MSWETLTFNSSSAIAPLPLRTTCLFSLKKEREVSLERRRRRKVESDIFFYIPLPKIEKSKKKFLLCFCPFRRKKKGTNLLTRILFSTPSSRCVHHRNQRFARLHSRKNRAKRTKNTSRNVFRLVSSDIFGKESVAKRVFKN